MIIFRFWCAWKFNFWLYICSWHIYAQYSINEVELKQCWPDHMQWNMSFCMWWLWLFKTDFLIEICKLSEQIQCWNQGQYSLSEPALQPLTLWDSIVHRGSYMSGSMMLCASNQLLCKYGHISFYDKVLRHWITATSYHKLPYPPLIAVDKTHKGHMSVFITKYFDDKLSFLL